MPVGQYRYLRDNVFDKLNREDWSDDGNWKNDWQAVNDATAFAPSVLYLCARGTSNENATELKRRADKTIDYEIALVDEVINNFSRGNFDYQKIGMALGGSYSFIAARLYYPRTGINAQRVQIYSRALALAPALALIYDPSLAEKTPYSPVSTIAYLAYYDLSLAEITQDQSEKTVYVLLGKYLVMNIMEKYWKEDNYGGYYKSIYKVDETNVDGPLAFEQGFPLSAWAKLFKLDSNSRYLINLKLPSAIKTFDNLYKNDAFVETVEAPGNNVKFLSSNLLLSRGFIHLYEALYNSPNYDARFIARKAKYVAANVLNFINNNFYNSSGRFLDHHLIGDSTKSGWYCTGCNFQALENYYLLWKVSP
jgi:hypothetical protein